MNPNGTPGRQWVVWVSLLAYCLQPGISLAVQTCSSRKLSGVIITRKNEAVGGIMITAITASRKLKTESDADGNFQLMLPSEPVKIRIEGKNIEPQEKI